MVVVVFAVVLPITAGIIIRFNLGEEVFTKEQLEELQQTYPWTEEEGPGTAILRAMGQTIIIFAVLGIIEMIFLLTNLSYKTTSAFWISSTALIVINLLSPGPAPTRYTLPVISYSIPPLSASNLMQYH